jgi:hypothetical protein
VILLWWEGANEAMTRLENDPTQVATLVAVRRTLGRLELDAHDPRLGTRQFRTEGFGHVWAVPDELTIVVLAEIPSL